MEVDKCVSARWRRKREILSLEGVSGHDQMPWGVTCAGEFDELSDIWGADGKVPGGNAERLVPTKKGTVPLVSCFDIIL